jgi:hypothetical protein
MDCLNQPCSPAQDQFDLLQLFQQTTSPLKTLKLMHPPTEVPHPVPAIQNTKHSETTPRISTVMIHVRHFTEILLPCQDTT